MSSSCGRIVETASRSSRFSERRRLNMRIDSMTWRSPSWRFAWLSFAGWNAVISTNLNGTWYVTQEVARQWMLEHGGKIVSIVADMWRGFPGMVHTGAARAGVENMTMSLAVEWSQFGILVNAVAPGVIISSGTKRYPPEIVARSVSRTPLKRAGSVDEVAASIVFLASPAAQFITGTTLRIDGGQALWGDTWELP